MSYVKKSYDPIATEVAEHFGITEAAVMKCYYFAKGIEAIEGINPELANSILSGSSDIDMKDIRKIGKAIVAVMPD